MGIFMVYASSWQCLRNWIPFWGSRWVSEHVTPFKGSLSDLQQPWGINRSRIESPGWYSANICKYQLVHQMKSPPQPTGLDMSTLQEVTKKTPGFFFLTKNSQPWHENNQNLLSPRIGENRTLDAKVDTPPKKLIYIICCPWKIARTGRQHAGFLFWVLSTPCWGTSFVSFRGVVKSENPINRPIPHSPDSIAFQHL